VLAFLPIITAVYFFVRRKLRNTVLLLGSLIFYAWGEPIYVFLMIFSVVINYVLALVMDKCIIKESKQIISKLVLAIAVAINIFLLGFFKYVGFLVENINLIFSTNIQNPELALPIGISFFTFQILSYVIDVYRRKVPVQRNIIHLGTYIALFPQLIAGPIVRYETIAEQLVNRKETMEDFVAGLKRFVVGLGKKVLIANNMAIIADQIYSLNPTQVDPGLLWLAAIAYAFQIYFDFSGYSDMAIGLGRMFGFRFLENFNYPYIARSVTDFWRRWHMSLSSWFKDYVYIPLGGNRVAKPRWILNMFLVWMLTGFWHGAVWNFVLWGLYFGVLLIIEKLFLEQILKKIPWIFQWLYTMIIVLFSWVIFRVEGLSNVLATLQGMFSIGSFEIFLHYLMNTPQVLISLPIMIIAAFGSTPVWKKAVLDKDGKTIGWTIAISAFLIGIFYLVVSQLLSSSYNPFIYFRF
jgi:alginate O-acetyltransferase complex protein AlgI